MADDTDYQPTQADLDEAPALEAPGDDEMDRMFAEHLADSQKR